MLRCLPRKGDFFCFAKNQVPGNGSGTNALSSVFGDIKVSCSEVMHRHPDIAFSGMVRCGNLHTFGLYFLAEKCCVVPLLVWLP